MYDEEGLLQTTKESELCVCVCLHVCVCAGPLPFTDCLAGSAPLVHCLLDSDQMEGVDPSRVVLGGFSMGGCLALASAYTYNKSLAGIVALSCWIPSSFQEKLIKVLENA